MLAKEYDFQSIKIRDPDMRMRTIKIIHSSKKHQYIINPNYYGA
jgi:hypothetical protein